MSERWPPGISDALSLPCSICGKRTNIDYKASDESWKYITSNKGHGNRLGVICLECFIELLLRHDRCPENCIESIYVIGRSATTVFKIDYLAHWPKEKT